MTDIILGNRSESTILSHLDPGAQVSISSVTGQSYVVGVDGNLYLSSQLTTTYTANTGATVVALPTNAGDTVEFGGTSYTTGTDGNLYSGGDFYATDNIPLDGATIIEQPTTDGTIVNIGGTEYTVGTDSITYPSTAGDKVTIDGVEYVVGTDGNMYIPADLSAQYSPITGANAVDVTTTPGDGLSITSDGSTTNHTIDDTGEIYLDSDVTAEPHIVIDGEKSFEPNSGDVITEDATGESFTVIDYPKSAAADTTSDILVGAAASIMAVITALTLVFAAKKWLKRKSGAEDNNELEERSLESKIDLEEERGEGQKPCTFWADRVTAGKVDAVRAM